MYTSPPMDLSVVIPARNEAENVSPLCAEIRAALEGRFEYEIIFIDDGSTDSTAAEVRRCIKEGRVRLLRHPRSFGQSASVQSGVWAAKAPLIATLDGDGQNDPADIPPMVAHLRSAPAGSKLKMVIGNRVTRRDTVVRRLSSRIANGIRGSLLRDGTPDSGCGIKVFDRDTYLRLPFFDHMHRFLSALFLRAGAGVESMPVAHRPRTRGTSKYGIANRLWAGIVDMLGVMWLRRRGCPGLEVSEETEA
ncbi:MAG: glycosyltransferase family 2 protein [Acidobacteria bacterium]|nr:glycosyltransferase family 2 protein [Acidobacteriota bacterium]